MKHISLLAFLLALIACVPELPTIEDLDCEGTRIFIDWENKTASWHDEVQPAIFSVKDQTVVWKSFGLPMRLTNAGGRRILFDNRERKDCGPARRNL